MSSWCLRWLFICGFVLNLKWESQSLFDANLSNFKTIFKTSKESYVLLQTSHVNLLSVVCVLAKCPFRLPFDWNFQPHIWQMWSNLSDSNGKIRYCLIANHLWKHFISNKSYLPVCRSMWFLMPPLVVKVFEQISHVINWPLSHLYLLSWANVIWLYKRSRVMTIWSHNSHLYG